jgi:DNA-directed RNA polymerase subunit beta'
MKVEDIKAIKIKLASPEEILSWSHGEVLKPETINYRTQRAEKDGLFCERIFGPEKDYQCYCGKYRGIRYKGLVCDRCGVDIIKSSVRRERMGHIKLACPVSHIWFLRGVPSMMGTILNLSSQHLEKIAYFASYIITKVDEPGKKRIWKEIEREYKEKYKAWNSKSKTDISSKTKKTKAKKEEREFLSALKKARERAKKELAIIKPLSVLSELDYLELSSRYGEIFEAGTGAEALMEIFVNFDFKKLISQLEQKTKDVTETERKKLLRRSTLLKNMLKNKVKPEWMFITILPVLPPALRPMVQLDGGRYASSDLNDLYRRVINRNNRLKYLLEINAPEVILRNEKRMLQEAVDALIDNGMRSGHTTISSTGQARLLKSLADMLKGKKGRFRQNLLGKRVDYSGRSVIVGDPNLKFSECGLPKQMALELFKPFVSSILLEKEIVYNVRQSSALIERGTEEVWEALETVIKDRLVLLNRAPTLHRLGVQAFIPRLVEGKAIRIHPLACEAFNADFDGDQMAVYVPLSEKAQQEARTKMLSGVNLLKPANGLSVVSPRQDMILGCYWLTQLKEGAKGEGKIFSSSDEAIMAHENGIINLRARIKVKINEDILETTLGRIIFNSTLPKDFPFKNELVNSRKIRDFTRNIIENYDNEITTETLDKIKKIGFEYATISGLSWGMDDLIVPPEKPILMEKAETEIKKIENFFNKGLLTNKERRSQVIEVWQKTKSEIQRLIPKSLIPDRIVFTAIDSGARGSWAQPVQMAGMKGLVINPAGQIMEFPAKNSFKEGIGILEYFISTHGARKGTADTALRTSTAGYLTRRLVDVAHDVSVTGKDCKDRKGIIVTRADGEEVGQDFIFKIVGRVCLEDVKIKEKTVVKKGEIISWEKAREIVDSEIKTLNVRSPLACKLPRGVCQQCYGWDLGKNKLVEVGEAVGVVAAQAIGEPGTQLTLRTFHTGGVASGGDITHGLPRVEEVFERRLPKGEAIIATHDGKVIKVEDDQIRIQNTITRDNVEKTKKKSAKEKDEIIEYKMPVDRTILVKNGDKVKAGQQLCDGSVDLRKLFKVAGHHTTAVYIVKEIQKIYASQGVSIHDKHIETIVKQMFSRVRIKRKGDSDFSEGQIVERASVMEENERLKKSEKQPIIFQDLILGISKVSLTTDSFLSAASFEETSRILIKASVVGQEDNLRGLKENVIIGKIIPVGSGYKKVVK